MANVPNPPLPIQPVSPLTTPNLGASATGAVTPSDSTTFPYATRALWVGGTAGTLVLTMGQGVIVTLTGVPTGTLLPVACTQVRAATTATGIVALN